MKIQGLAIIFIIIILPITIIIGEYANTQKEIFELEQLYDSRLITATHDGLKAFQINTFNDATSDISDSKIKSIEASANAFYNSMETSFGLEGYSKEELQMYVPALVYTMYDGYYIYSPYTNIAEIGDKEGANPGNDLDADYKEQELKINLDSSNIDYGFKPYVYYSCRYVRNDIDVIINYSLDNYITVQGTIGEKTVDDEKGYKSGYLVTIATSKGDEGLYRETLEDGTYKYYYSGVEILQEANLTDWLVEKDSSGNITKRQYKYIKLNSTKYYWDETDEYIFYLMGGDRIKQVAKASNEAEYNEYVNQIKANTSGINYYKSAYEFTQWVNAKLGDLEPLDAQIADNQSGVKNSGNGKIFKNKQIEYSGSNFNLQRKEVIRYSIESNLSAAIANFNGYTKSGTNFQMPKLKETEWEMLENEISIISFLQGINLGGKIYNGYTVVTNNKTEEVVKEERIYITTNDWYYHKINDKHFQSSSLDLNTVKAGVLDLDFEIRKDGATGVQYMQKSGLGCYTSIIGQENVDNKYDSIYEYLEKTNEVDNGIKQIYYTALGRERWGMYKLENSSSIKKLLDNMQPGNPTEGGGDTPSGGGDTPSGGEETPPTEEVTISVSIINYDGKDAYTIDDSGSVNLQKAISYTIPTTEYKVKYAFVDSNDIASVENIWEDGSVAWTECGASGNIYTKQVSEEGIWYLLAKVEDPTGTRIDNVMQIYTVTKAETTIPEITIKITNTGMTIDTEEYNSYFTSYHQFTKQITVSSSTGTMPAHSIQYAFVKEGENVTNSSWKTYSSRISARVNASTGTVKYVLYVKVLSSSGEELATTQKTYKFYKKADAVIIDPIPGGNTSVM